MLLIDIILALLLLGFVGAGAKDGFVHTLGRLIGAIIGYVVAKAWFLKVSFFLGLFMSDGWARLLSFAFIFIAVSRLSGIILKLLDGAFSILKIIPFLKTANNLLGGIIGFFEGIIIMGGVLYVTQVLIIVPTIINWVAKSAMAPWLMKTFQVLLSVLL